MTALAVGDRINRIGRSLILSVGVTDDAQHLSHVDACHQCWVSLEIMGDESTA